MSKKTSIKGKISLRPAHLVSCSVIAVLFAASPISFDLKSGTFSYQTAAAEKSCFIAVTLVRMADGTLKAISTIETGDQVIGMTGSVNTVTDIERVPLGRRRLYGFNGGQPFVTAEHPFYTDQGWKSLDPNMTAYENAELAVGCLVTGDNVLIWSPDSHSGYTIHGNLVLDQFPEVIFDSLPIESIDSIEADADTPVYNLMLDGDHTYFADNYLVHNKGENDSGNSGSGSGNSGRGSSNSGRGSSNSGSDDRLSSDGDDDSTPRGRGRNRSLVSPDRRSSIFPGDLTPARDLSSKEEEALISSGWSTKN